MTRVAALDAGFRPRSSSSGRSVPPSATGSSASPSACRRAGSASMQRAATVLSRSRSWVVCVTPLVRDGVPVAWIDPDAAVGDAIESSLTAAVRPGDRQRPPAPRPRGAAARAPAVARRRIVGDGDDERRRIERDLHDRVQQQLLALAAELRAGADYCARVDGHSAASALEAGVRETGALLDEVRVARTRDLSCNPHRRGPWPCDRIPRGRGRVSPSRIARAPDSTLCVVGRGDRLSRRGGRHRQRRLPLERHVRRGRHQRRRRFGRSSTSTTTATAAQP